MHELCAAAEHCLQLVLAAADLTGSEHVLARFLGS